MSNKPTLRTMLQALIDAGEAIGSENGPDPDYKRQAREDADNLLSKTLREIRLRGETK